MTNALEQLGMTIEDVNEVDDSLRTRPAVRDGRICLCGHGVSRHSVNTIGQVLCTPSKMTCPCLKVRPVLDVEDTRPFLRRTQGSGQNHALIRGLARVIEQGKRAEWIETPACDMPDCGSTVGVIPVPLTESGFPVSEPTGYNVFMCRECLMAVGGRES